MLKNPVPLPVTIAAVVLGLLIVVGLGYHFLVPPAQPDLPDNSKSGHTKFGGIGHMRPPGAQDPAPSSPAVP